MSFMVVVEVQRPCCDNPSLRAARRMAQFLHQHERRKEGRYMLNYALVFLLVGLIAGALGMFGVAAVATQIAWVLFVIGAVLLLVHLVTGRRTLTP
jgi:uncharacterized membrane protein YtjA (UPF0391 family)